MTLPRIIWAASPYKSLRDARYPIRGWVDHRIVGWLNGALAAFGVRPGTSRNASTHFVIGHQPDLSSTPCPECGPINGARGPLVIYQVVDLSDMAWGNGDVREPTWSRIIPGVNPNLYTVSVEHEDGGSAGRGVVTEHVWRASMELTELCTSGDARAIRAAGIRVRYDETVRQIAAIPKDPTGFIDHNQISGPNKPYCWRRWLDDPGFVEGRPSRRDRLLAALTQEDTVADIDTFKLETIRIDGNANIRSGPDEGASILFKTADPSSAVSVGWKGDFIAYWIADLGRWAYTSISANVIAREPYGAVVGVPQTEYDAALKQISALSSRIQLKDTHVSKYPKG